MGHLIAGVLLITFGLWGMSVWWMAFGFIMRGLLPFVLIVVGLIAIMSSYYRLGGDEEDVVDDTLEG